MTIPLPRRFLACPIAHRALHDIRDRRPENSRAAVRAAVGRGYAIEIDVQLSVDRQAVVFHDYTLDRLTVASGRVADRTAGDLGTIALKGGEEGVPTLGEILEIVDGAVPLLIEIKDQDGGLGPEVGPLEQAVAEALDGYEGDVAVMSFNPHSVAAMQALLPDVPRGLTTEDFAAADDWPVPKVERERLTPIPDYERVGAVFISHRHTQLDAPRVAELKEHGAAVLCWTVRSPEEEAAARRVADNITFERYLA